MMTHNILEIEMITEKSYSGKEWCCGCNNVLATMEVKIEGVQPLFYCLKCWSKKLANIKIIKDDDGND